MVNSKDISVIIQGEIHKEYTVKCIKSIRHYLPESEIILSTWENSQYDELDYDRLVLSKDPGNVIQNKNSGISNNLNRQLISSRAGIRCSERTYVLKLRTDTALESTEFLKLFEKYSESSNESRYFEKPILICSFFSRNPRIVPLPYHYSDWVQFGAKKDILQYYEIPLQTADEALWFENRKRNSWIYRGHLGRYTAEQHIVLNNVRKVQAVNCSNYYDNSHLNIINTERFLADNFVVFDYGKSSIRFMKYNPDRYWDAVTLYKHKDWKLLYNRYVLKNPGDFRWMLYMVKCVMMHMISLVLFGILPIVFDKFHIKEKIRRWLSGQ